MKKNDMLSFDVNVVGVHVSSTNPEEVKYFGQLLAQKLGEDKLFGPKIKNGTYTARYKFAAQDNTEDGVLRAKDIEWWLFSVAIQRGWIPFGDIGSFIKIEE